MKQILVLNWWDIKNPKAGGAEVHLNEIFSRLSQKGFSVTLICANFKTSKKIEEINGIEVRRLGPWWLINTISFFWYLKNKKNYDIVIDYTNKIPYLTPLYVRNKPLIAIAHHVFGEIWLKEWGFIGRCFRFFERLLYRIYKKTPIIAVSESTKEELIEIGLPSKNIQVIYNGISAPMKKGIKSRKPLIVYLGRLKKYKRIDWLLAVMPELIKTFPDIQLLIMGRGSDSKRLKKITTIRKIQTYVKFLGFVGETEKLAILRKAWLNIQPSIKEGWGFTVLEAAASGTPSLAANAPGLKETLVAGKTGWFFRDQKELLKLISKIINDPKSRDKAGKEAIKFAKNFDWSKTAQLFEDEILNII